MAVSYLPRVGRVAFPLALDEDDLANGTDGGPLQATVDLDLRLGADSGAVSFSADNATWNRGFCATTAACGRSN